jgi:hypothetical protein
MMSPKAILAWAAMLLALLVWLMLHLAAAQTGGAWMKELQSEQGSR